MLVKWIKLSSLNALNRAIPRLQRMGENPPRSVPRLISFGLLADNQSPIIRLVTPHVRGLNLFQIMNETCSNEKKQIARELRCLSKIWQSQNFVHGDLSPRNIIVELLQGKLIRIWCIGWVLDLKSFEATPYYSSKDVFYGNRSFLSDDFAIERIIKCHLQ